MHTEPFINLIFVPDFVKAKSGSIGMFVLVVIHLGQDYIGFRISIGLQNWIETYYKCDIKFDFTVKKIIFKLT